VVTAACALASSDSSSSSDAAQRLLRAGAIGLRGARQRQFAPHDGPFTKVAPRARRHGRASTFSSSALLGFCSEFVAMRFC
jgi:hypothetical protein